MDEEFKVPLTIPTSTTKPENTQEKEKKTESADGQEICVSTRYYENEKIEFPSDFPYKVPTWSSNPKSDLVYKFEVLKSGQIIDEIKDLQSQAVWKFGRLPFNDIEMAHPTISRYHAVLQYKPKAENCTNSSESIMNHPEGWYIYDLGSTHGTFLNKQRIPAHVYIRMRVGHMLRMGNSTRNYILIGPSEDEEPESELTVTELRAQRELQQQQAVTGKPLVTESMENNEGISWGMAEDANEETDLTHNPYACTNNEELFLDDPKRTLRGYFEREGLTLEYKCDELSLGTFVCRVELPIDDANGRPLIAEVVHKGKKKECVAQCALEACRILDRHGVLRQSHQEPLKRKKPAKSSDSDEDDFWDRTGDVQRKKERKVTPSKNATLTYEDLLEKQKVLDKEYQEIQDSINNYLDLQKRQKESIARQNAEDDDLDAFMENLCHSSVKLDKTEIRRLRVEEQRIVKERAKVECLIKLTKPTEMPGLIDSTEVSTEKKKTDLAKRHLPMIGKRNQYSKFKLLKLEEHKNTNMTRTFEKTFGSDEEEVEEDECENVVKPAQNVEPRTTCKSPILHSQKDHDKQNSEPANNKPVDEGTCPDKANSISDPSKKRRPRARQRNNRQDIDIDELEEHESIEKYAKWVPPANQSGDGFTSLNAKYGY